MAERLTRDCVLKEQTQEVFTRSQVLRISKTRRVSKSLFPSDDLTCNDLIKRVTETDSMPRFVPGINNRHQPIGTSSLTTVQSGSSDPINERERERLAPQTPRRPACLSPSLQIKTITSFFARMRPVSWMHPREMHVSPRLIISCIPRSFRAHKMVNSPKRFRDTEASWW